MNHRNHSIFQVRQAPIPFPLVALKSSRQCMQLADFGHAFDRIHQNRCANLAQNQHQSGPRQLKSKMRAAAHHVVRSLRALDQMSYLRHFRLLDFDRCSAQAVRAANFLHRVGRNRESLIRNAKKNYGLARTRTPRFVALCTGELHRAPTGTSRAICATRFSIAVLISSSASTSSTAPVLIASAGIPKIMDVASSCAITYPPAAFANFTPFAASLPMPVSTTATVAARVCAATDSIATSAHGR